MADEQDPRAECDESTGPDADAVLAHDDALADEMERESFPGSDPPSTWAGHDRPVPDDL